MHQRLSHCKQCGKWIRDRNRFLYCSDKCALISHKRQVVLRVTRKRKQIKRDSVEYLGGKCSICGYDKCIDALEFHHKDPSQKEFGIARNGHIRAWSKTKQELKKCILVCANCHREIHSGVTQSGRVADC